MILDALVRPRRLFNVADKKDIAAYKHFLEKNSWGNECCPFVLEEPYVSVPDMIKDKLVHYLLKVERI